MTRRHRLPTLRQRADAHRQESDDAAAFYKGRNPSACGNVIDHNQFIDCGMRCQPSCRFLDHDDGTRPEGIEQAGVLTGRALKVYNQVKVYNV